MTTPAEKAKAKKRASRPIYGIVRRLVDPETGELFGAIVPAHPIDQRLMRERRYTVGRELRMEIKEPRNGAFHRLAHAIGALLVDNVEKFQGYQSHGALKAVQAESGVCCDLEKFVIDLGQFGRHEVERQIPRSLAFDSMTEDEFSVFFNGITAWIGEKYTSVMLDEVRAEYWQMVAGERNAA